MSTRSLLLSVVLAAFAASSAAATTTVYDHPVGAPQLAVDAQGGAVLVWRGSTSVRGATGRTSTVHVIFASARPAGGAFGVKRVISTRGRDAARAFALAVGRVGDAAVVWRRGSKGSGGATLFVNRRLPGRRFTSAAAIPGSAAGREPAAAIDGRGRLLVAWLRWSGRQGCGATVMAAVAPRGGSFGAARRVSGSCPNAALARAALGPDGDGVVAWRAGRSVGYTKSTYAIEAAPLANGRFTAARHVSTGPAAGTTLALGAGGGGALVVWRDQADVNRTGPIGKVLVARIADGRAGEPVPVSTSTATAGPVDVAVNEAGAAIVTWEEGHAGHAPAVFAAVRDAPDGLFGAPERVAPCGATDASRTGSRAALDAAGNAVVAFQTACGGSFGIGSNYGLAVARRPARGSWAPPSALSSGGYAAGVRVAMGVGGETIAAWSENALRAAILQAHP